MCIIYELSGLNPVRSKLVKSVKKYPWSSHQAYVGLVMLPWLTTDWVFEYFSRQKAACIRQYSKFIDEGVGESYRAEFHNGSVDGRVLGNDSFAEEALASMDSKTLKPPPLKKIIKAVCSMYKIVESELGKPGRQRNIAEVRAIIVHISIELDSETLTEVARKFNRDVSTMSLAARKIKNRRAADKEFCRKLGLISSSISKA